MQNPAAIRMKDIGKPGAQPDGLVNNGEIRVVKNHWPSRAEGLDELKARADYRSFLQGVSEIDKARMAAFIDGEGSIFIGATRRLRGRMKSPQYRLQLIISNTNLVLMNWLKSTFDGSIYFVKYEKCKHLGKKQVMRWQVNERMAATLLEMLLPYFIVKKPQAEIALAFMDLKRKKPTVFTIDPMSVEELSRREELAQEIRRLNKSDGGEMVQ